MAPGPISVARIRYIFQAFLALGLTSFGGPAAHLGYFRNEFVARRRWLSEQDYADLVALCQFLPGPASSQVGFAIGLQRGGGWGAAAAWTAFTLPSAIILVAFALSASLLDGAVSQGIIHGLKVAAVAVVATPCWAWRAHCARINSGPVSPWQRSCWWCLWAAQPGRFLRFWSAPLRAWCCAVLPTTAPPDIPASQCRREPAG